MNSLLSKLPFAVLEASAVHLPSCLIMFTLQKTQRGLIAALVIAISALYFISSARLQVRNGLGTAFNPGRVLAPDLLSRQVNEAPMNVTATSDDPTFSLNHTVDESALRLPYEPNNFNIDDVRRLLGPPSGLAKRQEMSAYETCICKGIFMLARVRAGGHASNTPWRTMQQAEDNGWVSEDILWSDYPTAVFPANLKTPYQSLGISSTKRSNPKYGFLQSKEYLTINGEEKVIPYILFVFLSIRNRWANLKKRSHDWSNGLIRTRG